MPNRIIKESICTSDTIDSLSPFEEIVFYRLIVNCDDYGRFDARPKVLSARLFPLRDIPPEQMEIATSSLCKAGLITVYKVDGRPYILVNKWSQHQTQRAKKSKYPGPEKGEVIATENSCMQMNADEINRKQKSPYSYSYSRYVVENARAREDTTTDEVNPFGDNDADADYDELAVYAANNIVNMDGRNIDYLIAYREELGDELVRYGIDLANKCCKNGRPPFSYLARILDGYKARGITTVEQAEAAEKARDEANERRNVPVKTRAQIESEEFWKNVPRY